MKRVCFLAALLLTTIARAEEPARETTGSQAAEPTRIVLVSEPDLEALTARFAAELASLRFEVVQLTGGSDAPSNAELEALATEQRARAAVRVAVADGAIDLWLVNSATHEALYRRIAAERDPAVVVLRSLEILRGSLVDLRALEEPGEAPPRRPVSRPPAPAATSPRPGSRLWLGLGAQALWIGARSPAAGGSASLRYSFTEYLRLRGEIWFPFGEWSDEGEGGRVDAWFAGPSLGISVAPWGERVVTPAVGVGVAALVLHTRGEPAEGYRGSSDTTFVALPHGRFELAWRLSASFRAGAEVSVGYATPRPVLLFAQDRQEDAVNPVLAGGLGLELGLD